MPSGDLSAPALPSFPVGWSLGTPDLVVTIPTLINVPAEDLSVSQRRR
jgi:hypothetical protein